MSRAFIAIFAVLFSHMTDCYNWHSRNHHDHGDWFRHGERRRDSSESAYSSDSASSEEFNNGGSRSWDQNRRNWQHQSQDFRSDRHENWRPPNFHPHGFNPFNLRPEFNGNRFNRQTTVAQSANVKTCIRNCLVTSEYNPVCGTDNVTYNNIGRLMCAQQCGVAVEVRRKSTCAVANAIDSSTSTTTSDNLIPITSLVPPNVQQCISLCPQTEETRPVCGSDGVTYRNPSSIICAQMCGLDIRATTLSACSGKNPPSPQPLSPSASNCIATCSSTPEYNPVCGTNGVTYQNPSYLQCVRICGVDVDIKRRAPCSSEVTDENTQATKRPSEMQLSLAIQYCIKSCSTTAELSPVCGTNLVTYMNPSRLECAKKCGVKVEILHRTSCPSSVESSTETNGNGNSTPLPVSSTTITPPRKPTIVECLASCPQSEKYEPICGTNNFTFNNADHLLCAQQCGIDVQVQKESKCSNSETTTTINPPFTSITIETTQKPIPPITEVKNPEPFTVSIDVINSIFTTSTTKDPTEDIDERVGDD